MTRSVLWQQGGTYQAQDDRHLMAAVWPTPGVINGLGVTVGTGRTVNIAAGNAAVSMGGNEGTALAISDAIETATFAAAPSSGQNRIDLLIAQVHDPALDIGTTFGFTFDIVLGTAAASPVAPAVPARAQVIATVTSVGGQANLAQANIVAGAVVNPANSHAAGHVTANIGMPVNTLTTIMSTAPLAPGVWDIMFIGALYFNDAGSTGGFRIELASGAATMEGVQGAPMGHPAVQPTIQQQGIIRVHATVTATAVFNFNGMCAGANGGYAISNSTYGNIGLNVETGYVATRIA